MNEPSQPLSSSEPSPLQMERIRPELDAIAGKASAELRRAYSRREFARILRAALPLVALVPLFYLVIQLAHWNGGGDPRLVSALAVAAAAVVLPLAFAWMGSREAREEPIARSRALGEVDRQLALEGRLQAADDFSLRTLPTGFERAAIEDAEARTAEARAHALRSEPASVEWGRKSAAWGIASVALLLLTLFVGTLDVRERYRRPGVEAELAAAYAGEAEGEEPDEAATAPAAPPAPVQPAADPRALKRPGASEPEPADASPDASQNVKESAGKTGSGRSSGALSSSAGSDSRSAPSSQGQKSQPGKKEEAAKKRPKKKPKVEEELPTPEERPQEEESGATAGRGSSKGSNKNPTASDWRSRDQVTESDEQEIEDDDDTEDDEEEQENRGGVQPSLRDRRPPVSRDLQISFGNRSNPDANGRGGPSEQKKSRGVASLVLGVPIPDRIKGRPGKGPTKITQERIEPQAEEADPISGASRMPRAGPTGSLGQLDLEPGLRDLVRRYFLARRAKP